ncbi:Tll0287-like domain-containing protein [Arsukibacterium perlucidum]|uniref:Tll0287-like domain-containing protein n=1 Tax=Arsukibacterium perlucidum TaxID=368811 RepID=UPI000382B1C5|nr:DUF3365 domain-containing protein [Arsukibacterium perlucidum]
MRHIIYLLLSLTSLAVAADSPNLSELQADAQQRIKGFSGDLKSALQAAISSGGLPDGVKVCKDQAPRIAEKWSGDGWQIGRTSLKVRNSSNQADAWEQQLLLDYMAKLTSGTKPAQLKRAEIVSNGDTEVFRYMQPIMLDTMCVACHGSQLAKPVQQQIQQHYPADLATGYSPGELRGAFTVKKQL